MTKSIAFESAVSDLSQKFPAILTTGENALLQSLPFLEKIHFFSLKNGMEAICINATAIADEPFSLTLQQTDYLYLRFIEENIQVQNNEETTSKVTLRLQNSFEDTLRPSLLSFRWLYIAIPLDATRVFFEEIQPFIENKTNYNDLDVRATGELLHHYKCLLKCMEQPCEFEALRRQIFIENLLLFYLSELKLQIPANSNVSKEYLLLFRQLSVQITSDWSRPIPSLENVAKDFSMSASNFRKVFKEVHGDSFYQYFLKKKMEYSKHLLMERKLGLTEIASNVGFKHLPNFIRTFQKITGEKPSFYTKR